jgi:predicted DNA-binding transcriptional regulator AlpA
VTNGYLGVEQVAARFGVCTRTVHEWVKRRAIPHRRLPAVRPIVFLERELDAWVDGAELEEITPSQGGRIVRPKV